MNELDQYRQVQIYKSDEVLVRAPAKVVWPYLLDFASFNDTFESVELLWGEENTVGAISRLTKRKGQWWMPPFLVKIIFIDPGKQVVWKAFPEEGESFSRFADFSLRAVDNGTMFTIRSYMENRVSVRSAKEEQRFREEVIEASNRLHREVMFPNLKRLAEGAANAGNVGTNDR